MITRYPETVLTFNGEPPLFVDLRVPVTQRERDSLQAMGMQTSFAVVTACNPMGKNISDAENEQRSRLLEAELVSSRERFVRVDACSPDKSHCEPSVAVKTSLERAVEIAKRYDQVAIFWFDGAEFWIEPVLGPATRMRLPARDRPRP